MARRTKAKQAAPAAANDPTPERAARDAFAIVDAPRMADEQVGRDRLAKTRRQVSRIGRMEGGSDPWINRMEAAALERYELLIEQAGYDAGSRGCLSTSSGGGGDENDYDHRLDARVRLARAANAIAAQDQVALLFVNAVLSPYGGETMRDVIERLLRGRADVARVHVVTACGALVEHFMEERR